MARYDSDEHLASVAQSCKHFSSGGKLGNRFSAAQESISCRVCKNSNGSGCVINAFDNVLTRIECSYE